MAKRYLPMVLASAAMAACSQAAASPVDPQNDIHCSVAAFYFKGHPVTQGSPPNVRYAVDRLFDWYSIKVRALAAERGAESVQSTAEPVLEAIKRDFLGHREHLTACTDRAVADPTFNAWLRSR